MKCYTHPEAEASGTCTECGRALCSDCIMNVNGRVICRECAGRLANGNIYSPDHKKDPFLAVILALLGGVVTGSLLFSLGQLYNGQVKKFIAFTIVNACIGTVVLILYLAGSLVTAGVGCCCCLPVFALPLVVYLYELYDAYDIATRINNGELVQDWFD